MTEIKKDIDKGKDTTAVTVAKDKKFRVAVYGSLRKGLGNHGYFLGGGKGDYIGTFTTDPEYTMYSVAGAYPALVNKGYTPIVMEVYEVDEAAMDDIDSLEGYRSPGDPMNLYEKTKMATPYGEAWMYLYNEEVETLNIVEGGDWTAFKKASDTVNCTGEC